MMNRKKLLVVMISSLLLVLGELGYAFDKHGGHGGGGRHGGVSSGRASRMVGPAFHPAFHPGGFTIHHGFHPNGQTYYHVVHPASHRFYHVTPVHSFNHIHTLGPQHLNRSMVVSHHPFIMNPHTGIPHAAFVHNQAIHFNPHQNWAVRNNQFYHSGWYNNHNWYYPNGYFYNDFGYFLPSIIYSLIYPAVFYPFYSGYYWNDYYPYDNYNFSYSYPNYNNYYENDYYHPIKTSHYTSSTSNAAATEKWVAAENGDVPDHAVVNDTENNTTTYYCRAKLNGKMYYGVLIPKDACYIQQKSVTMQFSSYEVLVT